MQLALSRRTMLRLEQVRGEMLERFERFDRRFAQNEQRLGRIDQRLADIAEMLEALREEMRAQRELRDRSVGALEAIPLDACDAADIEVDGLELEG
jgi:hypothetical protein